jgi:hypothetical protein
MKAVRLIIAALLASVVSFSAYETWVVEQSKTGWRDNEIAAQEFTYGTARLKPNGIELEPAGQYVSCYAGKTLFREDWVRSPLVAAVSSCRASLRAAGVHDGQQVRVAFVNRRCGLSECSVLLAVWNSKGDLLVTPDERRAALTAGATPAQLWFWAAMALAHGVPLLMAFAIAIGWWPRRD